MRTGLQSRRWLQAAAVGQAVQQPCGIGVACAGRIQGCNLIGGDPECRAAKAQHRAVLAIGQRNCRAHGGKLKQRRIIIGRAGQGPCFLGIAKQQINILRSIFKNMSLWRSMQKASEAVKAILTPALLASADCMQHGLVAMALSKR